MIIHTFGPGESRIQKKIPRYFRPCLKSFAGYTFGMVKNLEKTPRMGRPPKPPGEKQSAALTVALTPAERELVERAAAGRPTATWARETLLRAARRAK